MVKAMTTALVLIASGEMYRKYAARFLESVHRFFVPQYDVVMFTDEPDDFPFLHKPLKIPSLGYPQSTLLRYHMFHAASERLKNYDYIFYSDVDMLFVDHVKDEDIFANGITATLHPGFV